MASVSGLSYKHRLHARDRGVAAAVLGYRKRNVIAYDQGSQRWSGIDHHRDARKGEVPPVADCSAFVTWCLWNGLVLTGLTSRDTVNGENWRGGFTGTGLTHGKPVRHLGNVLRCDVVYYGEPGTNGEHEAIVVGTPRGNAPMKGSVPIVVSHGSDRGPLLLPYNYRTDIMQIRRHI